MSLVSKLDVAPRGAVCAASVSPSGCIFQQGCLLELALPYSQQLATHASLNIGSIL